MSSVKPSQNITPPNLLKARLGPKSGLFNADALAKAEAVFRLSHGPTPDYSFLNGI